MSYTILATPLADLLLLKPKIWKDERGFFLECYNERDFFQATGLNPVFVQDSHSRSKKGVLRGLHYQIQHPQGKLVRVARGQVFDVSVNLQKNHPDFGKWFGTILSEENQHQLWIPPGFAHGFVVLSDWADFVYKTTDYYAPEHERALLWNDPALGIDWPINFEPLMSFRDLQAPCLNDIELYE